jgi:hypothetical protein
MSVATLSLDQCAFRILLDEAVLHQDDDREERYTKAGDT